MKASCWLLAGSIGLLALGANASSLRSVEDVTRRLEVMEYMAAMSVDISCYLENGFDYVGMDIKTVEVHSTYPESCCWHCHQTEGCRAYSYTKANGGTCYLKSGRGQIVVNPAVTSSLLVYGVGPVCQLKADIDFVGNDLAHVPSGNAEGCCLECMHYPGCRAYTWTDFQGGTCWLKSRGDQTVARPGAKAAQAFPTNEWGTCALDTDRDYIGNDIGNAPSPNAEGCCQICRDRDGCYAYSWNNHNGGTCWLKSTLGDTVSKPGVISATVAKPRSSCSVENDIDYVGNDIANRPSAQASACCSICRGVSGCKAFSWSNHNGGTCWLKSAKGATVSKTGVKSGVV